MRHRDGSWHRVDDEVAYVQALSRSEAANRELAAQLQEALDSRVVIEQAEGLVAGQRDITVDEAFELLRDHGRRHGTKVTGARVRTTLVGGAHMMDLVVRDTAGDGLESDVDLR